MRELIHSVYPKCSEVDSSTYGCIGTIETENCVTNKGLIGGEFRESNYGGDSEWSLINRWDANKKIHKKILDLYNEDSLSSEFGLEAWVTTNRFELFSNNGKYTPIIAEVGREFVDKGVRNENYAKNIIKDLYNLKPNQEGVTWKLYTNCSGSINDTIHGQDIVLEFNDESLFFQVKPLTEEDIKIVLDDRGEFYKVNSHHSHRKYKMNKVDIIIYVDSINEKYIVFNNDYNYIQTILSDSYKFPFYIDYYELPLFTNMNIEKVPLTPPDRDDKKLLQKSKEEKIKFYKERIKYFKDKLKELGISDDLMESIKKYKNKLLKLLTQ